MRARRAGRAWQAGMLGACGCGAQGAQAAWALGGTGAGARQQAGRACVGARTGSGARTGARGMRSRGAAGVRPRRWARGLGAWAGLGLALGSALGALGPFSIRFDSFFFLSQQMNTVHCKIKFFQKKKN